MLVIPELSEVKFIIFNKWSQFLYQIYRLNSKQNLLESCFISPFSSGYIIICTFSCLLEAQYPPVYYFAQVSPSVRLQLPVLCVFGSVITTWNFPFTATWSPTHRLHRSLIFYARVRPNSNSKHPLALCLVFPVWQARPSTSTHHIIRPWWTLTPDFPADYTDEYNISIGVSTVNISTYYAN